MNQRGFIMVELIVTISILSFGIIGVYLAFNSISSLAYNMSYRLSASYLVEEGLDIIRNMRDNNFIRIANGGNINWSAGLTGCSNGCQADYKTGTFSETPNNKLKKFSNKTFLKLDSDGFYSYDKGADTKFKRKITIGKISNDTLKVTVQVFWNYNKKSFQANAIGFLYNWH